MEDRRIFCDLASLYTNTYYPISLNGYLMALMVTEFWKIFDENFLLTSLC